MAMNRSQALNHRWQSKEANTHRVRFFTKMVDIDEASDMHNNEIFWKVAEEFKLTPQAQWVDDNDIKLAFMEGEIYYTWGKMCIIYGDITERQYVDYSLRFFVHQTDWK
jgi:hypothetical protein